MGKDRPCLNAKNFVDIFACHDLIGIDEIGILEERGVAEPGESVWLQPIILIHQQDILADCQFETRIARG